MVRTIPAHTASLLRLTLLFRSRPVDPAMTRRYIKNSLRIKSAEMKRIQACAQENSITVALGFSENDHGSLYISQCTISEVGEILMQRRKLMATHMERTIFGNCSGNSLDNVVSTPVGNVGQLACWEHVQPLLKYHTIAQREAFHVAAWPPVTSVRREDELWSMSREGKLSKPCSSILLATDKSLRNSQSFSDICD